MLYLRRSKTGSRGVVILMVRLELFTLFLILDLAIIMMVIITRSMLLLSFMILELGVVIYLVYE